MINLGIGEEQIRSLIHFWDPLQEWSFQYRFLHFSSQVQQGKNG